MVEGISASVFAILMPPEKLDEHSYSFSLHFLSFFSDSDLNNVGDDDQKGLQDIKLKLMLGISLSTLFLFVILLAVSSSLLYKLKTK